MLKKKTKKKEPAKKKLTGRPKRDFDPVMFQRACESQCTVRELEYIFHADMTTFDRWCREYYGLTFQDAKERFSAEGNQSVRRAQFKMAQKNASMSIWWGKNYLGQKENPVEYQELPNKLSELLDLIKDKKGKEDPDGS